jgi:hypothetical protein
MLGRNELSALLLVKVDGRVSVRFVGVLWVGGRKFSGCWWGCARARCWRQSSVVIGDLSRRRAGSPGWRRSSGAGGDLWRGGGCRVRVGVAQRPRAPKVRAASVIWGVRAAVRPGIPKVAAPRSCLGVPGGARRSLWDAVRNRPETPMLLGGCHFGGSGRFRRPDPPMLTGERRFGACGGSGVGPGRWLTTKGAPWDTLQRIETLERLTSGSARRPCWPAPCGRCRPCA